MKTNNHKEAFNHCLESLEKYIDPKDFRVLGALVQGLVYSEETALAVRSLGKEIAQELYDCYSQNFDYEVRLNDWENPHNWNKVEKLLKEAN